MNYLNCLAEIRGNLMFFGEVVSKNKRCRIFRRNTVYIQKINCLILQTAKLILNSLILQTSNILY